MKEIKNVLIISYSLLERDPRVLRQIHFLSTHTDIFTAGLCPSKNISVKSHINIKQYPEISFHYRFPLPLRKIFSLVNVILYLSSKYYRRFILAIIKNYELYYWNSTRRNTLKSLLQNKYDLIIANDIEALPIAVKMKQKGCCSMVYFDAHEYSPLELEDDPQWLKIESPYYHYLCKKYIPFSDYCTTVGYKIAEKYTELTGVDFDVIFNAPVYQHLLPQQTEKNVIRFIHNGAAVRVRQIEVMIDAFIGLGENFELHFLMVKPDPVYFSELQKRASGCKNIFFHDPVSTNYIPRFINQFDVSLLFIPPVNFNYKYCLPNKFFESVQARLMLLSGPSDEMASLIERFQLGIISNGFDSNSIRSAVESINTSMVAKYKSNSDANAREVCAEAQMGVLYNKLSSKFISLS